MSTDDHFYTTSVWRITAAAAKSCLTLWDPIDSSPPGSPIPGILQARTLEWVAISFSNAWKWKVKVKSAQSSPILSDPVDCSLPGSSAHGVFQARVLEWVNILLSQTLKSRGRRTFKKHTQQLKNSGKQYKLMSQICQWICLLSKRYEWEWI